MFYYFLKISSKISLRWYHPRYSLDRADLLVLLDDCPDTQLFRLLNDGVGDGDVGAVEVVLERDDALGGVRDGAEEWRIRAGCLPLACRDRGWRG